MAASGMRTSDAMLLRAFDGLLIGPARSSLRLRRRLAGYVLAAALVPVLAVVLAILRGQLSPTTGVLTVLTAVVAVALLGGLVPATLEAIAGSLLNFYFTPPMHTSAIAEIEKAAAVAIFIAAAVVVGLLTDNAVRYAGQAAAAIVESEAARPIAEADRMRTALLAAVSHDLRTPLAAAQAAVSCLRATDIQLTAEDHDELLATAEESLGQLSHLLASLLDVSRLQAGVLPVFPRPANLEEIIARTLGGIGPRARAVNVRMPPELPRIMVDPSIMERVIANVTANALRYSPSESPPLLTASASGGRVILRVVDYGPGVPEADRNRIFAAFQRLGNSESAAGVGLGLTLSRGLAEAMHGTLEPEETSGGGLTMAISVPVASGAGVATRQDVYAEIRCRP
ncbi:MAG: two-component system, OmpR family, sensor histidine kinase KdpD [Trebonia sp.]|nr:two-component system, OmpR family, sensor histidine kinase KdpD [Trebonia sp.]